MDSIDEASLLYDLRSTQPATGKYHGGGEYGKIVFEEVLRCRTTQQIHAYCDPERWVDPKIETLLANDSVTFHQIQDQESLQ